MSEKDRYIALCNTEESIPLFGRPWWLDVEFVPVKMAVDDKTTVECDVLFKPVYKTVYFTT